MKKGKAKSAVMQPKYRQKVEKSGKGKGSYERKPKHKENENAG